MLRQTLNLNFERFSPYRHGLCGEGRESHRYHRPSFHEGCRARTRWILPGESHPDDMHVYAMTLHYGKMKLYMYNVVR